AQDQTWTGTISCDKASSAAQETKKPADADSIRKCVESGGKYVFVSQDKVYNIDNQDFADLAAHAGRNVKATGTMAGASIKVARIEPTPMKPADDKDKDKDKEKDKN